MLVALLGIPKAVAQPTNLEAQPVDSLLLLSKQVLSLQEEINNLRNQVVELQDFQQTDGSSFLPFLLAILAIIISIVALVIAYKKYGEKSVSTNEQSYQFEEKKGEKKENYLLNEVRRLEHELFSVNKRVEQLTTILGNLKQSSSDSVVRPSSIQPTAVQKPVSHQPHQQLKQTKVIEKGVSQFQKQTFYADLLDGDGIAVDDLKVNNSEYMLLKIVVIGPTEAEFEVNDLPSAQQTLVSSYKFTIGNFVVSSSNSNSAQHIITRIPGRLRLQGDRWVLEQKASIVLE